MPNSKSSKAIPSVKSSNHTLPNSTIRLKGWLNKQKHGKCRAWVRRYFVLYGDELRYYKNKNDTNTLAVIYLDHYSLVPDAQPLTSLNQKQWRFNTFCLVSDDETKFDWPDYFLQAENADERENWVDCLEGQVSQQKTVLEKWLERLEIPHIDDAQVASSLYTRTGSDRVAVRSSMSISDEQHQHSIISDNSNVLLPSPHHSLRNHKSAETLSTFTSKSSNSLNNVRRPSNFIPSRSSDVSNKLFSSKLFSWNRSKQLPSISIASDTNSIYIKNLESNSSEMLRTPNSSLKPLESPIIHPSEYDQEDSPIERVVPDTKTNIVNDQTTTQFFYCEKNMYPKEITVTSIA